MDASEARVLVYTCNWNAYSSLEAAGEQRLSYPADVHVLRVPCLGRLHPGLILKAFEFGAGGVLLLGCQPEECHYDFGSRRAREVFQATASLARLLGIGPERLGFFQLASGDGRGFVDTVTRFAAGLGPAPRIAGVGNSPPWPISESPAQNLRNAVARHRAHYCLDCGKCTASCPVSRREAGFSPRAIVEAVLSGQHEPLLAGTSWSCLTCRRCSEVCPSDVRFSEFIRDVRLFARQAGQQGHCSHGEVIHSWMRLMAHADLRQNRLDWLDSGLRTSDSSDTVYFVGCLPYYEVLFGEIGTEGTDIARSAVRILNHLGIDPVVMPGEVCCGHDLLWEGDVGAFRRLAERNAAMLRATGARRIVTTCPECAYALQADYRQHGYPLDMPVLHIAQLLAGSELKAARSASRRVTYQDPCRLGRFLKVYDEPRKVMASLGATVLEMEASGARALCCGTSAWVNCGATSKAIQVDRLRQAKATGAETLVTACVKCQIHFKCAIDDARLRDELEIEIKDLATLVAEALPEP